MRLLVERLRESEARLALAVEIGGLGHWELDLQTFEFTSSALCRRNFGRDPAAPFTYEDLRASIHPDDRERQAEVVAAALESRSPFEIQYRALTPAGEIRHLEVRGRFESDSGSNRLVGVSLDISASKQAEENLRRQTDHLEALNRIAKILSSDLDLERIVQTVTDSATALSGAKFGAFFYNVTDTEGERYLLYTLSGAPRAAFEKFGLPRNTALFGQTFRGEGVVRSDNIHADPRYGKNAPLFGMPKGHLPVVSYLAVPVISRAGQVHGGLFFGHDQPGVFTRESEDIVTGIAFHAALAIDKANLLKTAQTELEQRTQAEALQAAQKRVLELALADAPLEQVLDTLARTVEAQSQSGMLASILLLDRDGVRLCHGAAPSLPQAYNDAIDGIEIGPNAGSCGTAAYLKQPVHVFDIASDPLWADFKDLAAAHELKACWSIPFLSSRGRVLGTFAMYYRQARAPGAGDLELGEIAARMASLMIERKQAEQHRELLIHELNHRVKNTLATVQSVAMQTMRNAGDMTQARDAFESRLIAMAKAHDVLTRENWESANLREIVTDAVAAYASSSHASRFDLDGPHLRLQPRAALALSMALHELATNAVKYGALSNDSGCVRIAWWCSTEDGSDDCAHSDRETARFHLRWTESDGPPVAKPARRGFGSRLIEEGLAHDLDGAVQMNFASGGVTCEIEAPLGEVRGGGGAEELSLPDD